MFLSFLLYTMRRKEKHQQMVVDTVRKCCSIIDINDNILLAYVCRSPYILLPLLFLGVCMTCYHQYHNHYRWYASSPRKTSIIFALQPLYEVNKNLTMIAIRRSLRNFNNERKKKKKNEKSVRVQRLQTHNSKTFPLSIYINCLIYQSKIRINTNTNDHSDSH